MSFFGELYLRSTLPFLPPHVTQAEVACLARAFADVAVDGPILDLGCGHGRHAAPLDAQRVHGRRWFGLDFDALSLSSGVRAPGLQAVRADLRALPVAAESLAGAFSWYSSLFVFQSDDVHAALLRGIRRALRPGGRLVLHTVPFERLAEQPPAQFRRELPDGSVVEESSRFDVASGIDHGRRTLRLPDGRVLSGEYAIRYYPLPDLRALLEASGYTFRWAQGGLEGGPVKSGSNDLILGVDVRHG